MSRLFHYRSFLLLFIPLFCASCISKKKHLEALTLLQNQSDAQLRQEVELRDSKINIANKNIEDLRLQLAERKGENNILVDLRKELEVQINDLESNMENMSSRSSSSFQCRLYQLPICQSRKIWTHYQQTSNSL